MIISHKKNFVMLLPWKTASQTIRRRLASYDASIYPEFYYFNVYLNRVTHQHLTYTDYLALPESRLGYLLGVFIRNPYDRVYSGFRQLQKDIERQPKARYPAPWVRDLVLTQLEENSRQLRQAQFKFDDWLRLVREEQVYEIGRNSSFPLHPVHYWTHHSGDQKADFVGRVEDFERDFQSFLTKVGIGYLKPVNENVDELHGDSDSNPYGYRYVNRMNSRSIGRINELFRRDFDYFGYDRLS